MALVQHSTIVAVDFGTSRSGFSYFTIGGNLTTDINTCIFPNQTSADKTLTQILYDPKGIPLSFGFDVPRKFSELQMKIFSNEELNKYSLFKFFKMELRDEKNLTKKLRNLHTGKEFELVKVIADYLGYIREKIEETLGCNLESSTDIRWVFTVPAIWTDKEKHLTKEACVQAGIISHSNVSEDDFLFAPEPEAAAAFCMHQMIKTGNLSKGETFLVVDAGGGTVDLTSHSLQYEGIVPKLKSLTRGSGGPWGSLELDNRFFSVVANDIFGTETMKKLAETEPILYFELGQLWESIKLSTTDLDSHQYTKPSSELHDFLVENGVSLKRKTIHLEPVHLHKIFNPILEEICQLIQEEVYLLRKNTKNPKASFNNILVVGGFGQSKVLQSVINQRFGSSSCRVTCPNHAGTAIVKGAVMLGVDPSLIMTRRMRRAYGISIVRNQFNPNLHRNEKKTKLHGADAAEDCFDAFVEIDEEVAYYHVVTRMYSVTHENQKKVNIELYASCLPGVVHTDDEGTYLVGSIRIDLGDTKGLDRKVVVAMAFGKSEIEISAHDVTSGKAYMLLLILGIITSLINKIWRSDNVFT